MIKAYIAHNFNARLFLRVVISGFFKPEEFEITSRWITDDSHCCTSMSQESALVDIEDIDKADVLILCVDQFAEKPGKGKWFEFGYAYKSNKKIVLVGENMECIFRHLPNIVQFSNWRQAAQHLKEFYGTSNLQDK